MTGFYLLALGIASGLLWIPCAELVYAHRITPKLAIICLVGRAMYVPEIRCNSAERRINFADQTP
jgi:cytochrome c biogenesis protein CcdA